MSGKVGHVSFDLTESPVKPYSEATGSMVDSEVRKMLEEAMERTLHLLRERKDEVERLAELLLEQEVLEREDMVRVLGERPWPRKPPMMTLSLGPPTTLDFRWAFLG